MDYSDKTFNPSLQTSQNASHAASDGLLNGLIVDRAVTAVAQISCGLPDALGSIAKCTSPCESERSLKQQTRRERFELGRIARYIYASEGARIGLDYPLQYHRTASCGYSSISNVEMLKSVNHGSTFYTGLATCGSVWTCPTCSAKIQERRRTEIAQGMEYQHSNGKKAVMITLTFSHKFGDDVKEMLDKQSHALKLLRSGKAWTKFKAAFGFDGLIRATEVTFGQNGFHPHVHELWFLDNDRSFNRDRLDDYLRAKFRYKRDWAKRDHLLSRSTMYVFEYLLKERWEHYCAHVGLLDTNDYKALEAFRRRAVDIKDNCSTSDYLAKQDDAKNWGADREIAKASTKKGRKAGIHPFQFLTKFKETSDSVWAKRWLDYSLAFKGRSQLFWSKGLKDQCGIDELSDEQIAELKEEPADVIYRFTRAEWRSVRNKNKQAHVLDAGENGGDIRAVIADPTVMEVDLVREVRAFTRIDPTVLKIRPDHQIKEAVQQFSLLKPDHQKGDFDLSKTGFRWGEKERQLSLLGQVCRDRHGNIRVT